MTCFKNKDIPCKLQREKGKNFASKSYPHENVGDFLEYVKSKLGGVPICSKIEFSALKRLF